MTVRLLMFSLTAILIAFGAHIFFGSTIAASAEEDIKEVVFRTTYEDGAHHISGMVAVPSECHDLQVRTTDFDPQTVLLVFETWEQPYRTCEESMVPKAFRVIAFAPEDVAFRAVFDGEWRPIRRVSDDRSL